MSDYSDIQAELDDFKNAVYGEEVRDSMISAIKKIHDMAESGGSGGQPTPVRRASHMLDTEKLYLYLGEETGYQYGYIYAYTNGAWASTGLYGKGEDGASGADGYSPTVSVSQTATGVDIRITDKNGTTSATVENGTATDEQVAAWLDEHPEATTTVQDGSISVNKLASSVYGESSLDIDLTTQKVVAEVSDTSQLIKGTFNNDIPVADDSGTRYFTDYLDLSENLYIIGSSANSGNSLWRVYDSSKNYLGSAYKSFPTSTTIRPNTTSAVLSLNDIATAINSNAAYIVITYYATLDYGAVVKVADVSEEKLLLQGKEFTSYAVEEKTVTLSIDANGAYADLLPVLGGETYTGTNGGVSQYINYLNACKYYLGRDYIDKNNGTDFTITTPADATYILMGGGNTFAYTFTGNFPVEKLTAPNLKLVADNFTDDAFDAIATGLGISVGRDVNEVYYNCTKYGVIPANTDNTSAMQALIDTVHSAGGGTIWIPNGTYIFKSDTSSTVFTSNITGLLEMKSNVNLLGESIDGTVLKVTGNTSTGSSLFIQNSSYSGSSLVGCKAENFTVDMSEASLTTYSHRGKAFYYSGIKDCIFRDLRLISTPSTSLGIDMLDNVVIDSIYVYQGGRQWSSGGNGGAGIGIGTGKWPQENYIIRNCICDSCGHFGIFLEDQGIFNSAKTQNFSMGQIIANNIVRSGRNYGIGLRGGRYVNITGNNIYSNANGGIYLDYGADRSFITGNLISDEANAICFGNEATNYVCTRIAVQNNTFAGCTNGVVQTLTPTDCVIQNNITVA